MAAGQAVLSTSWDLPALRRAEERLEQRAADHGRVHAATLRDVLAVHAEHLAAGMGLMTESTVARLLRVSEWRAGRLVHEAVGLGELPRAFEALEWGLLHPDQCSTVVTRLAPLTPPQRLALWQRLLERLGADAEVGAVLPPTRLGELLKAWVQQIAPQDAVERRQAAEDDRSVEYRKRDDGLADVFLLGLRPTDAQAVLQRIRAGSAPVGPWDDRLADQRRLDAAVDLLLGRDPLGRSCGPGGAAGCGCLPGQSAPCGAGINVHVTLNAALGTTDEPARLDRQGPIEPDLLEALLLNAPVLRAVFVDEHGTPIGVSRKRLRPDRADPASVREALLRLANLSPDRLFPIHPDDHQPTAAPPPTRPTTRLRRRGHTHRTHQVPTASPGCSVTSSWRAHRDASGRAAGCPPRPATPSTTTPGQRVPPAPAVSGPAAGTTTASSSSASPRPGTPTAASPGRHPPASRPWCARSTSRRVRRPAPLLPSRRRTPGTS